jgi:hypothetical protein
VATTDTTTTSTSVDHCTNRSHLWAGFLDFSSLHCEIIEDMIVQTEGYVAVHRRALCSLRCINRSTPLLVLYRLLNSSAEHIGSLSPSSPFFSAWSSYLQGA